MIKVIEGMEPWKVMKAASEGKRVAHRSMIRDDVWVEWKGDALPAIFNFGRNNVAIIDESQPSIDWDGVVWKFFEPYGGLILKNDDGSYSGYYGPDVKDDVVAIAKSPLYPWTGGECPVPANVEVEVTQRSGYTHTAAAGDYRWEYANDGDGQRRMQADIINFRITGRML